jgi:pimeloyl-ACP methyl ester carboxylesterase
MAEPWLVFGGWGFSSEVLWPLFGENSVYIDTNGIMSFIMENGTLRADWIDFVRAKVKNSASVDVCRIAGWSTGAIIACGLALSSPVERVVLLSATPSFCRREGFKIGQRPGVLEGMRKELLKPENSVLDDFRVRSGIKAETLLKTVQGTRDLIDGLHFLEQVNLLPNLKKIPADIQVFHGDKDLIIPHEAGKMLADRIGAHFSLLSGGHAFFTERHDLMF